MNCMKFISLFAGLLILPSLSMADNVSFETTYSGNPALYNAYKGLDDLGVKDAWDMGYTGEGWELKPVSQTQALLTMAGPLLSTWIRYLSIISKAQ